MDEQEQIINSEREEVMPSPVANVQEEDVLVEENVTPFFMNSGRHWNVVMCSEKSFFSIFR